MEPGRHFATMLVIAVLSTVPILVAGCGRTSVVLRENGYQQLLVAIDDEVESSAILVQRIKDVFTNASRLLYQMTRQRAFFEDVHILLPDSWPDSAEYQLPTWQQVDKSDVTVGPVQGAGQGAGDAPFTVRTTPCGELGSLLHLTPAYLLNDSLAAQYGPYDKAFLHEWSHLRYGVFDEYSDVDTDFYAASNGELEGIRCPAQLQGEMFDEVSQSRSCGFVNGQPDANCRFHPDMSSLPARSASLMFHTRSGQISEWCDDDVSKPETLHNRQAPSQHNRQCGGRSVWEVLRSHGDFRDGQNPPSNVSVPSDPAFTLVKRRSQRTALVLDVSGSMQTNDRIARLRQVASNYLLRVARDGEEVGIVWFNEVAFVTANLTRLSNVTRRQLLQQVPSEAQGGTGIGDGLLKGLDVLQGHGSEEGGTIILLSDGIETHPPYVNDVLTQLVNSSVRVHIIAVSGEADASLETVAKETGGLSFAYSDTTPSNTLNDAFLAMADAAVPMKQQQFQLASLTVELDAGLSDATVFIVDSTANNDVSVAINYAETAWPNVTVTSPSGRLMTSTSNEYQLESSFKTIYFSLGLTTETGEYRINVTNQASTSQTVFLTVTARMTQGEEAPVIVRAQWRHQSVNFTATPQALYVIVSKGYNPLLNAEVTATVENPPATSTGSATSSQLLLRDNGAGSDVKADDGVYSSYVTTFTANGRYNVRVNVRDAAGTVVSDGLVGVGVPPPPSLTAGGGWRQKGGGGRGGRSRVPMEPFQRVASAGSFVLRDFDPSAGDVLPPSAITDLLVRGVGATAVQLEWTAPGDDLDHGTASGYVLKMSRDFEVLFNKPSEASNVSHEHVLSGDLNSPLSSGSTETLTVYVAGGSATYYFAIQAYDNSSNLSPPSNIISATTAFADQDASTFDPLVLVVVIAVVAVLLIVSVVVGVVIYRRHSGTKNLERQRTKVMHPKF